MPADATIVALRKDVAQVLRDKEFGQPFTVRETYTFQETIEATDHLNLLVGFASWSIEQATRSTRWHDYEIDVGAQYRVKADQGPSDPLEKFDAMMLLLQEIGDYFWTSRPTLSDCFLTAVNVGGPNPGQPYVPQHLFSNNQFTGVLRLAFRKER